MSKPGPNDNEPAKSSRMLRRVESLMSFMGIASPENTVLSPAPTTPAPVAPPTPALAPAPVQNVEKEPKEKKEKSAKSSRFRRISMQILPSSLFAQPSAVPGNASSSTDQKKEKNQEKGAVAYETHDKKKIYTGDLIKLPVTVCTYAEREQQLKIEKMEREQKEKQREQSSTSSRLPTLQELFTEPAPPVRRGSVIYNGPMPRNAHETQFNELEALAATPPAPRPILMRTSSMVLLDDVVTPAFEEETKKRSPRP